ncbi:MAG: 30S ribosomal protein S17 [Planctomycetota bacterium]|jgi:small subunit ribosomal protein S17
MRGNRKVLTGRVTSNKMNKTISVMVETRIPHPIYGKFRRRQTPLMAHDEKNEAETGDVVQVMETRPLSKRKRWRLVKIVKKQAKV